MLFFYLQTHILYEIFKDHILLLFVADDRSNTNTNNTVTSQWAQWRLKSSLHNRLLGHGSKENIKAPRYWPLWQEIIGDRWFPWTKGQ